MLHLHLTESEHESPDKEIVNGTDNVTQISSGKNCHENSKSDQVRAPEEKQFSEADNHEIRNDKGNQVKKLPFQILVKNHFSSKCHRLIIV